MSLLRNNCDGTFTDVTAEAGLLNHYPTQTVVWADFNNDGHPDYLLYNASTRQTAIWYLNNNVLIAGLFGPTLPAGWSVVAP